MTESLKTSLDRANPNTLPDMLRSIKLGQMLASDLKQTVRRFDFNAAGGGSSLYNLATVDVMALPNDAKAISILRAYARSTTGGGTLGELAPQAFATTPADSQIAVAPNGDIVTVATSNYDSVDVEYLCARGDVIDLELPVASDAAVLPAWLLTRGVLMLLEAEALTGTVTGKSIIIKEADGKPGTTRQASLMLDREAVQWKATDGVTSCRLKLLATPEADMTALLEAESTFA